MRPLMSLVGVFTLILVGVGCAAIDPTPHLQYVETAPSLRGCSGFSPMNGFNDDGEISVNIRMICDGEEAIQKVECERVSTGCGSSLVWDCELE